MNGYRLTQWTTARADEDEWLTRAVRAKGLSDKSTPDWGSAWGGWHCDGVEYHDGLVKRLIIKRMNIHDGLKSCTVYPHSWTRCELKIPW